MKIHTDDYDLICKRDPKIFGHFLEHFHRQIYGGIYDPGNDLSDSSGFREDIVAALKALKIPVLRWPGGCFVSSYHWTDGVGETRIPSFDKAWRVEESNRFGTDEFIALCRLLECDAYICTNAGKRNSGRNEQLGRILQSGRSRPLCKNAHCEWA